jgi:transcriptional regulator with XRE-family HTH domain
VCASPTSDVPAATTGEQIGSAELGQALIAWRAREALSRLAAARRLGVAHTTLRGWEVDAICPQPLQLRLVADALGLDDVAVRALAGPDRIRTARTSGGPETAPLCRARLAVGLTMTQLARKVGVGPATVSRWENGLRTPSSAVRPKLATALRVTAEELGGLLADSPNRRSDGVVLPGLGRLRRDRGLGQRNFRSAVGIGATAANAWENGRVRVPAARLTAVAEALDLDVATLVSLASRPLPTRVVQRPLTALRRSAGLTQRELAHHLGVSVRSLAHWEAGTRPVPLSMVRPMARHLRRPLSTVLSAARLELPAIPHPATWTPAGLPEVLTALRCSSGWSAAALGRRLGTSSRVVRRWESGTVTPSARDCLRLELVHGLPHGMLSRLISVPRPAPEHTNVGCQRTGSSAASDAPGSVHSRHHDVGRTTRGRPDVVDVAADTG